MSTNSDNAARIEALAAPICSARGVEFVDVKLLSEKEGLVIRVMIDRERADGKLGSDINIDDCGLVMRDLADAIDADEKLASLEYRLEVTSPGVERPLVRLEDYTRFAGREAKIKTRIPIEDRRSFEGLIVGADQGNVRIEASGRTYELPFETIVKANLVYRFGATAQNR
jgi:ribosome maturation factor RimP